ncbi:efflux RND transporter periplasmic adaptor subunit [Acuticoccus sp. I52.16.1]|uniref:efflux RND transporter periplasmic adaptor subunit n=1 Tax=Acuticoccus sp. I52.16.1 TaxID=2928472 RepID=UPI001FD52FDC|nr:efflux RND transporter periplasmic adaptor subunit [Acuticoccus sp. I52.16.1]UOM35201.1 efflux RND transporter periplasmic adaptor subunit [Acuticoccus sp. I52.16.1]
MTFRPPSVAMPVRSSWRVAASVATLLAAGSPALAQSQPGAGPPPAVVVTAVKNEDVTRSDRFVGRVQAIQSVDLIARVEGFLETVNFKEGSMVQKNELLMQIEKAPYQAALANAQAQVAAANSQLSGAQAQLKNADVVLQRQQDLLKRSVVSQAQADDAQAQRDVSQAKVEEAKAAIQQAEANVQTAQLNLSYTDIVSPIDGRIGLLAITEGNLVNTQSGTIANVVQIDPIRVAFSIPETLFTKVAEEAAKRQAASGAAAHPAPADAPAQPAAADQSAAATPPASSGSSTEAGTDAGTPASGDAGAPAGTDTAAAPGTDAGTQAATPGDATTSDSTPSDTAASDSTAGDTAATTTNNPTTAPAVPQPSEQDKVAEADLFTPELMMSDGTTYGHDGKISFASNQIDASTGSLVIYADFPNPNGVLLPGAFVNVTVKEAQGQVLPVVPVSGVLQDAQGRYVFVLNAQNKAEVRRIQTGPQIENGFPVTNGLTAGEIVIVQGLQKVQPGIEVSPTQATNPAVAGSSSTAGAAGGSGASGSASPASTSTSTAGSASSSSSGTASTQ